MYACVCLGRQAQSVLHPLQVTAHAFTYYKTNQYMLIGEKLELIRYTLVTFSKNFENYSPMTRRLLALGVVTELFQLNKQLEELCLKLDSEISIEDAINGEGIFNITSYHPQANKDTIINHMTDYLPLGAEGYSFTTEQADSFKTGMHQFCDEERLNARDIIYTLCENLERTVQCLNEVKKKKTNIPSYLYEDYWFSFMVPYLENNPIGDIYEHWKDVHDDPDLDMLRDKQQQEILLLLKSGFFSHTAIPTRREIRNSIISINKDAFETSAKIPDDIDLECARMSKYVEWKDNTILTLNYEKLGKYIYKHQKELTEKEKKSMAHFDIIMDMIHEDMAALDSKYKIYLKNYEGDELQIIYDECKKILNSCLKHRVEGIDEDFFGKILYEVMNGDMKNELKTKLGGASRMTTLCAMLAACKNSGKVFRFDVICDDLANSLATIVERPSKDSLKRYIDNGSAQPKARIFVNTEAAVKNYIKNKADNPNG